jgi:uroporphyrinogen III methyltransferase / synthase
MAKRALDKRSRRKHAGPKQVLIGKRIVITRAYSQAGELAQRIKSLGGEVIEFPTIEIGPPESYEALDAAIRGIQSYDWIIFTSVNGVERFLQRVAKLEPFLRGVTARQIAAIGPKTAETLAKAGLKPAIVPEQYLAEGILKVFRPESMRGKRVLIPRAAKARDILPQTLREWGARVDVVETYRTTMPNTDVSFLRELILEEKIDMITFTSPSTVSNFVKLLRLQSLAELPTTGALACIGPITQETLEQLGGRAHVVAEEFTMPGLVRAIVNYFAGEAGVETKDRE